jgi:hypothetical protein
MRWDWASEKRESALMARQYKCDRKGCETATPYSERMGDSFRAGAPTDWIYVAQGRNTEEVILCSWGCVKLHAEQQDKSPRAAPKEFVSEEMMTDAMAHRGQPPRGSRG